MRWFLVLYGVWGLVEVEAQSSNDDSNPSEIVYQENSISVGPSLCKSRTDGKPRLNPTSLSCESCPVNQVVSDDGMSCVCDSESRIVSGESAISYYDAGILAPIVCERCPGLQTPSADGMFCVSTDKACDGAKVSTNLKGEAVPDTMCIRCSNTDSTADVYSAGFHNVAKPAPYGAANGGSAVGASSSSSSTGTAGASVDADFNEECVVCPSPHSYDRDGDGKCDCEDDYMMSDSRCFKVDEVRTTFNTAVTLPDDGGEIAESQIIRDLLPAAYASCYSSVTNRSAGASESSNSEQDLSGTDTPADDEFANDESTPYGSDTYDESNNANDDTAESAYDGGSPTSTVSSSKLPTNETACQVLANLCVLQNYKKLQMNACGRYLDIMRQQIKITTFKSVAADNTGEVQEEVSFDFVGDQNGIAEWPKQLPWLYYAMRETEDESKIGFPLNDLKRVIPPTYETDIKMKGAFSVSPNTAGKVSTLQFKVAVHNLYGRFLGFHDMSPQIQRCHQSMIIRDSWLSFGTPLISACKLRFDDFPYDSSAGLGGGLFFDPFLVDQGESGEETFYPVPVLNMDYVHTDDEKINVDPANTYAPGRLLFTRRFFMLDNISTIDSATGAASKARVATGIDIQIRLRAKADGGIYPPVLSIDYDTIDIPSEDSPQDAEFIHFKFTAGYSSQLNSYEMRLQAVMVIFIALSITLAYNETRATRERNGQVSLDPSYIFSIVLELTSALSTSIFAILTVCGLFFLLFSKTQRSGNSFILPPRNDEVELFELMLALGSCMKLSHVVGLLVQQSAHDVFFIDWEHPRSTARSARRRQDANAPKDEGSTNASEISAWRRLFVANEWNELQTEMQVPTGMLLVLVLLFLYAADAKALANPSPKTMGDDYVEGIQYDDSKILRFAVAAVLFLPIGIAMWVFNRAVYSRLVVDTMGMFEDLCAMSNISVMVLTHKCHGYYIHGQSVHEFADVSLHNLREQIWKESTDRTARRGMVESSDHQTFQIHVPQTLRDQWDKLLDLVDKDQSAAAGRPSDETARTYAKLNLFFTTFIRKGYGDQLSWVIKKQKYQDVFMSLNPRIVRNRAIFYEDNLRLYTGSLLWGQTGTLLINLFMMFAFVDWFTQNWIYATIVTWFIDMFVIKLKQYLASNNLSRKSLVDKAFML